MLTHSIGSFGGSEKRKSSRITVNMALEYHQAQPVDARKRSARLIDFSNTGFSINTLAAERIDDLLMIKIPTETDDPVQAVGRVRWCDSSNPANGYRVGISVLSSRWQDFFQILENKNLESISLSSDDCRYLDAMSKCYGVSRSSAINVNLRLMQRCAEQFTAPSGQLEEDLLVGVLVSSLRQALGLTHKISIDHKHKERNGR